MKTAMYVLMGLLVLFAEFLVTGKHSAQFRQGRREI